MKLEAWMKRESVDDSTMAGRLTERLKVKGLAIDRTSVSRIRRGKQWPSRDYHTAIYEETAGEVGADPGDYAPSIESESEAGEAA